MIIPWHVDVPEDRWPVSNWLIIAGIIAAFIFQVISIKERRVMLKDKMKEYANCSVEEMAKDLGADEQRVKEIRQAVEKNSPKLKKSLSKDTKELLAHMQEGIIKRALLEDYFVWKDVRSYILRGWKIKGLLGHIWLHNGILHIVGNLLFLWIFGNAVCAKIGNFLYAPFYILAGIMAGIAYLMFQGGSALGASGAINGVVGMYLVFFPINTITCCYFYWIPCARPIIGQFELSSFWMILFWLAFDIYGVTVGDGRPVGYFAHLGGFATGFIVGIILLKCKIAKMERWERSLLDVLAHGFRKDQQESQDKYNRDVRVLEEIAKNEQNRAVEQTPELIVKPQQHLSENDFAGPLPEPSEPIRFVCECGKRVKIARKFAGLKAKCPRCGKRIKVPKSN